jgi:hypothetical protein
MLEKFLRVAKLLPHFFFEVLRLYYCFVERAKTFPSLVDLLFQFLESHKCPPESYKEMIWVLDPSALFPVEA